MVVHWKSVFYYVKVCFPSVTSGEIRELWPVIAWNFSKCYPCHFVSSSLRRNWSDMIVMMEYTHPFLSLQY
jgi:hypothetical protein